LAGRRPTGVPGGRSLSGRRAADGSISAPSRAERSIQFAAAAKGAHLGLSPAGASRFVCLFVLRSTGRLIGSARLELAALPPLANYRRACRLALASLANSIPGALSEAPPRSAARPLAQKREPMNDQSHYALLSPPKLA